MLFRSSDLLSRNVPTAEWLRHGLASFFETPQRTFFDCTALPSWTNLVSFRYFRKTGQLPDDDSAAVLLNTITDQYFSKARATFKTLPAERKMDTPEEKRARQQLELAQATSWALTYFLMNNDLDGVFAYLEELRQLPRDVEFDAPVLAGCFARAFKIEADPDNPLQLKMPDVQKRADQWFAYLGERSTSLDISGIESQLVAERIPAEKKKRPTSKRGSSSGGPPPR